MLYSPEAVRQAIDLPSTITGRSTQGLLWVLKCHLIEGLHELRHPDRLLEGFVPYLRTTEEQTLISTTAWMDPPDRCAYFQLSITAITERQLALEENK